MDSIVLHPTYFPSIAAMSCMVKAKEILFEVHDNYQKQTYRNRAHIAHTNGVLQLNIPIKHSKNGERQKTSMVEVENSFPWQSQHWKSIQTAYRTSPFFEFYEDELVSLFTEPVSKLMDHNFNILDRILELFGWEISYAKTNSYEENPEPLDLRFLVNSKKEATYPLQAYTQVLEAHHGFLSNLSVLDLLFNEGPNALHYLESQELGLQF